jgi:hypothetical protein
MSEREPVSSDWLVGLKSSNAMRPSLSMFLGGPTEVNHDVGL